MIQAFLYTHRWKLMFLLCLASRLVSTIYYIEDPDSMRFALATRSYDLVNFQPHFPGYPVFCFTAMILTWITGSFALSFSLIGGLATFLIIIMGVKIIDRLLKNLNQHAIGPIQLFFTILIFFNPFCWLMSNRYMPDLSGFAVAMIGLHYYLKSEYEKAGSAIFWFAFTVGVLAGWRLSYLPILIIPAILLVWNRRKLMLQMGGYAAGILIWFIPVVVDTGWQALFVSALQQTTGHFNDFGGAVTTEPDMWMRIRGLIRGLWADGLGGWWPGRNLITGVFSIFVLAIAGFGLVFGSSEKMPSFRSSTGKVVLISFGIYLVWVFVGQNVVYKARHVLPLIPFILFVIAWQAERVRQWKRKVFYGLFGVTGCAYILICMVLVYQHTRPTAIAQVKQELKDVQAGAMVVSIPLVNEFLRRQGAGEQFVSVEDSAKVRELETYDGVIYIIGEPGHQLLQGKPDTVKRFYHNPFVNRMWPTIEVKKYR